MTITLQAITLGDLQTLALARPLTGLAAQAAADALPPPFVAQRALRHRQQGKPALWCSTFYMVHQVEGRIVGSCGFKDAPLQGRVEIGYGVSPLYQRQGIATAAVSALLALAFDSAEVEEVLALINPANAASMQVVRKLHFEAGALQLDEHQEPLVTWSARKPARSN